MITKELVVQWLDAATFSQLSDHRAMAMHIAQRAVAHGAAQRDAELEELKDTLLFVERWANHHGTKPHMTAKEALSVIQHHPAIKRITGSYANGVMPTTPDPYAENEALRTQLAAARLQASKPLTDEQIAAIGKELGLKCRLGGNPNIDFDYARAIEAAHGITGETTWHQDGTTDSAKTTTASSVRGLQTGSEQEKNLGEEV